jgi:tRNA threonylcarbamoyl adenosine modification protein YeaZ
VALLENQRLVALLGISGERGSSEQVLGLVQRILDRPPSEDRPGTISDVDVIAVSRGPGSMTGLRVGIGSARGIAAGSGKRLVGVSTLQALAACAGGAEPILALLDAGRGEVYGGLFGPGDIPIPLGEERIATPQSFADAVRGRGIRLAGAGGLRYRDLFPLAVWNPGPSEDLLAAGVGRIAAVLLSRERTASAESVSQASLDPSPRYLRRDGAPLRFEE